MWNRYPAEPLQLLRQIWFRRHLLYLCTSFFFFPGQKWRERLEGQPASSGRESHSSGSGEHRCQECLQKAVEVKELTESLQLVRVRSRAAVDRSNAVTADLEREREQYRQQELSLREAKSEVLRVKVRKRGDIHTLRHESIRCFCNVFVVKYLEESFCGVRRETSPVRHVSPGAVFTSLASKAQIPPSKYQPGRDCCTGTAAVPDDRRYTLPLEISQMRCLSLSASADNSDLSGGPTSFSAYHY